jgi:hypothetical protein
MANLWRVLALSWLGGVASPILMDDPTIAEAFARPVAAAIQPAGELACIETPSAQPSGDDEGPAGAME